jgi:hypothetical protein
MPKNNYVIPPEILEVLGPPPLLASESPKRWNETLARYTQSYPPKDADDFEGWKDIWNLACDNWEEERMKRFKAGVLEIPYRARLQKALLARVDKVEDELRTQAFDQMLARWEREYPASRRRAESNERLPAETKGLRAEADPKLPAEARTIPAVTATEPAPLLPPATDADYADAFVENMPIYYCADQIQNSARKRYDAVRVQIELRRAAELASKMVNGEVAPTECQLQSGEVSSVEDLSEPAPATTSVLLSSIQPVRSPLLLEPPNSPEPRGSSEVSTASAVEAAPTIELSTTAVGETSRSASSPQFLQVPNSSEPQESSEVSTASAVDVTAAIEPSTAVGDGGRARVPPAIDTNNLDNNNVATDPSLPAPPAARASSPSTWVTSTAVTAAVGAVIAGAVMSEPTPAAEGNDERDRVESPGALVQPSQQHQVASAQEESEVERIGRVRAWVRQEIARRDAERAQARSR